MGLPASMRHHVCLNIASPLVRRATAIFERSAIESSNRGRSVKNAPLGDEMFEIDFISSVIISVIESAQLKVV